MSPANPPRTPQNKLTVAGFALGPAQKTFDPTAKPGSVLGSAPAAGTEVPRGTEVSLEDRRRAAVPDVRGTSTKDAKKAAGEGRLHRDGRRPGVRRGHRRRRHPAHRPRSGDAVDPNNAKIFLVPSNAVTVPDLTDDSVRQAEQKLDKLGLKLSVSSFFGGDDSTIWNQSPGAGGAGRAGRHRIRDGVSVAVIASLALRVDRCAGWIRAGPGYRAYSPWCAAAA